MRYDTDPRDDRPEPDPGGPPARSTAMEAAILAGLLAICLAGIAAHFA